MSDLGLGDLAVNEKMRLAAVRWHFGYQPVAQPAKLVRFPARPRVWIFPEGVKTYKRYLKSALWKQIRQRILERDDHTCQVCLGPAVCVHHIDYSKKTLAGKRDKSLISLCNACHHKVEHQGGRKIPCSEEDLKRQLLSDLMLHRRGVCLEEWQRSCGALGQQPEQPRRAAKRRRKKMDVHLRSRHAEIGAAAEQSLKAWRAMRPWERTNFLKSLGGT